MKLTCVTAVFNAIKSGNKSNLVRCIESVAALATEHEHLIYDGASTDGTVEILRGLEKQIPNLKVVSEKDTGIYNALNKGVRDAKGEWFYVLGADDYIKKPTVMDEIMALSGKADMIVTPVEHGQRILIPEVGVLFFHTPYGHQGMLLKTSFMRECGGFDEQFRVAADYDVMIKAHLAALHIKFFDSIFAYYSDGGMSDNMESFLDDTSAVLSARFGLTSQEIDYSRKIGFPPARIIFRFLFFKEPFLRTAARQMAKRMFRWWIKGPLRTALYPLVVLTRPIRHRK